MLIRSNRLRAAPRPGAVLPLVALCMVGLLGFTALAIDLGVLMIARNNCQNAADSAAIAAVRTINGDVDAGYRLSRVSANGIGAAAGNRILSGNLEADENNVTAVNAFTWQSGDVKLEVGSYTYDYNDTNVDQESFILRFPRTSSSQPYGAVRSTVKYNAGQYAFARIWGFNSFETGATATAVHRPRDVVIVMDLSGSMRFQSLPGTPMSDATTSDPSSGSLARTRSLNPDPIFPLFGHYSDVAGAALRGTTSFRTGGGEYVDPGNQTYTSSSGPPIAEYFFTDVAATNAAFVKAPDSMASTPGGDNPLRTSMDGGSNYAKTLREVLGTPANETNAAWEDTTASRFGYTMTALNRTTYNGFTRGPGYWGKTFFIWPPDPGNATAGAPDPSNYADNGVRDWRQRFFIKYPIQPAFIGRVERTPVTTGTTASNEYAAAYNGWYRITGLTNSGVPAVGDSVTIANQANRVYYITAVRASTWNASPTGNESTQTDKIEIQLNRALSTRVSDTSNVQIQFRRDGWVEDNDLLWTSTGQPRAAGPFPQSGTFDASTNHNGVTIGGTQFYLRVNYAAILNWIRNIGTNPFPSSLRGGGLLYYSAIPDPTTDTGMNDRLWAGDWSGIAAQQARNEQFWKEYIDFVLGMDWRSWSSMTTPATNAESYTAFRSYTSATVNVPFTSLIGAGNNYNWTGATVRISPKPTVANTTAYMSGSTNSALTVGSTSIGVSSLTKVPRTGDFVQFTGDSTVYTVLASPAPRTTSFSVSPALTSAKTSGTSMTFKQLGYMHYDDNPLRPRSNYWFGPATMIDWLGNYNTGQMKWPGNVPEAQSWACKMGINVAISDIRANHPNDFIGTVFFSSPRTRTAGATSSPNSGYHNRAKVQLRSIGDGNHFKRLSNSLWFPPKIYNGSVTEIAMFDSAQSNEFDFEVPRANGGTSYAMGFMLAYNQLSSSRQLGDLRLFAANAASDSNENGIIGGASRKGAQKMIIFESDGAPNTAAVADFTRQSSVAPNGTVSNDSYYKVRIYDSNNVADSRNEYPQPNQAYSLQGIYDVVDTICNLETDATRPGHATGRRPVLIHTIGYGTLFSPSAAGATQTSAMTALQTIQFKGKTATDTSASSFPQYKRIYGTTAQRIASMKDAFTAIMQDGVSVTLVR